MNDEARQIGAWRDRSRLSKLQARKNRVSDGAGQIRVVQEAGQGGARWDRTW